ncbi:sensor histidine kinase [Pseudohoeflea coraliihabitans]|uniref:C4-dicarboxylate transport sensor protein n=1 Tax=Pseudohoeflea coraliihabitans TaxID=2860393 RepID=A0ABS6WKC9_9HYPH|nr:ATP-binding protein [Pseudohoeflea sp. DP4N28-3]MBW3096392.1 GHKL domain-containing protein [Pseudohoeflea sp. DP4N28-3]
MQSRVRIESRFRKARSLLFIVWVVASALIVGLTVKLAADRAETAIRQEAGETLAVQRETLTGVLDKYRLMAPLLARQSSVASLFVLDAQDNPQELAARRMAHWLTGMSAALDVAFFFPDGRLLGHARSDFVAQRTGLSGLITEAAQGRLGRAMLWLDPQRRSYAFSSGVRRNNKLVGIVVVYVDFFRVETAWALSNKPIFVTDAQGTVVLANVDDWRLQQVDALRAGSGGYLRLNADRQRGDKIDLTRHLPVLGWQLHVLADPRPITVARVAFGAIATLACLLFGLVALILLRRGEDAMIRHRADRATALRLERKVRDRTRELSRSNTSLSHEVEVRRRAEERLRAAQSELVQSAKLAALGQMSAAISHEFNQPLAAIRSYSETGQRFLDLGKAGPARDNLGRINALVDRMAELSRTLLSFARKPGQTIGPVPLRPVIEEALLLARPRARAAGVDIFVDEKLTDLHVCGGRVRLGQVFVNLVNNAVDAMATREDGWVRISARRRDGRVEVTVSDNGPGIVSADLQRVFDPFYTTKGPGEGIGIGLSIVDNILRDFGGTITVHNRDEGGAIFTIDLIDAATGDGTGKDAGGDAEAREKVLV